MCVFWIFVAVCGLDQNVDILNMFEVRSENFCFVFRQFGAFSFTFVIGICDVC